MTNHANGAPSGDSGGGWVDFGETVLEVLFSDSLFARLVWSVAVFAIAWALSRYGAHAINRSAKRLARRHKLDDAQLKAFIGRGRPMILTLKIGIGGAVVVALLGVWGLTTAFTGLLVGAGFAGIVIGLAAADTIGDVIAGFLIFYNHPFDLGDWVDIDGVEGIVEDVALGATTLITWDNEKMTIPNRLVEGTKVKNYSHDRVLRRRLVVGVEYGSHLGRAMQLMVELAKKHPEVLPQPEPSAVTTGFGDSSVVLVLRFYVEPVRSSAIKVFTDLVHQVHDAFRKEGIVIAFPHMQIVQNKAWRLDQTPGGDPELPA